MPAIQMAPSDRVFIGLILNISVFIVLSPYQPVAREECRMLNLNVFGQERFRGLFTGAVKAGRNQRMEKC